MNYISWVALITSILSKITLFSTDDYNLAEINQGSQEYMHTQMRSALMNWYLHFCVIAYIWLCAGLFRTQNFPFPREQLAAEATSRAVIFIETQTINFITKGKSMKIIFPTVRNLSAIDLLHFPAEQSAWKIYVINCDADDNRHAETHFLRFSHIRFVEITKIAVWLPVQSTERGTNFAIASLNG